MRTVECDTVVLGAGSAGLEAFREVQSKGVSCVIIELGPLGTSAQRSGELPLSLLMSAGIARHAEATFDDYGIETTKEGCYDISNVLNSIRQVRSRATSDVLSFLYRIPEERRLKGVARFIDTNNLVVENETLVKFKTAIICTGSTPMVTYEQSRLKGVLTINEFFELEKIPSSVAIFGSTLAGLQLGQSLAYLGVNVAVFGQRKLWDLTDENVLTVAHRMLSSRFNLYVDTFITSIENEQNGYAIYYIDDRKFENYLFMEGVIAATDRIPNVGGMNLQDIGISLNRNGSIKIDEKTLQTTVPNIFAAGDVCHVSQATTLSIAQGRYAGRNAALFPNIIDKPQQVRLSIVHTDPVLAIVGLSLNEMKERADKYDKRFIITQVILHLGQYRSQREDGGVVCIYTDVESHEVKGAEICAVGGDHIAQMLAMSIHNKATVDDLAEFNFYHLSHEKIIAKAAKEALRVLNSKPKDEL